MASLKDAGVILDPDTGRPRVEKPKRRTVKKTRYKFKPAHFRVLIKQELLPESIGGIITGTKEQHEDEQAAHTIGTIVHIGETAFDHERFGNNCPYNVGDLVYFRSYAGDTRREVMDHVARWSGDIFKTVNDDDILGWVEKEKFEEEE